MERRDADSFGGLIFRLSVVAERMGRVSFLAQAAMEYICPSEKKRYTSIIIEAPCRILCSIHHD
jgi:hypothetical protein